MSIQIKVLSTLLVAFSLASFAFSVNAKQTYPAGTKSKTISDLACADGEIAKFNQTNNIWECATDEIGSSSGSSQFVVKDSQGDQFGDVLFPGTTAATIDVVLEGKRLQVQITPTFAKILTGGERQQIYCTGKALPGGESKSCHTTPDCSDTGWYYASQFTPTDTFLTGFDYVVYQGNDIVEPTGTPQIVTFTYWFNRLTSTCDAAPPKSVEVYSGIAVVASDIFADFPTPYTLEVQ